MRSKHLSAEQEIWFDETHFCDDCRNKKSFPDCRPKGVEYGSDGNSAENDNIIRCKNYEDENKKIII